MRTIERWIAGVAPAAASFAAGCAAFRASAPEGFAAYEGASPFRAVSPDGIAYRVREVPNEPTADLPFWKEALRRRMVEAGYRVVSVGEVTAEGSSGVLLELAAPHGEEDFIYLVALFVRDDRLVIVEAAGEAGRFRGRRDAVLAAIGKIRLLPAE